MKKSVVTTILIFLAIFSLVALFSFNPAKLNKNRNQTKNSPNSTIEWNQIEQPVASYSEIMQTKLNFTISENGQYLTHNGLNGYSALDLLKKMTDLETKDTSFGPQVIGINGIKATDKEFWLFSVNGQPAAVGAADYQTKDSDIIEWRLSGI